MIKFGVTTRKRAETILPREQAHTGWWPFAFTLLEELEDAFTEADEPLIERLYQALAAGDGIWKITKANRFRELDEQVDVEIDRRFESSLPLVVHDMAASNGVTSLDWYERISADRRVTFYVSDYFHQLVLVARQSSGWTVVCDVDDRPLQCVSRRFVISCRRDESWRYPVNRVLQRYLQRNVIPAALRDLAAARVGRGRAPEAMIRQVSLFHPRCLRRAVVDKDFRLAQHDIFTPNPYLCHVVRVMNALTPHHYSTPELRRAIQPCIQNLQLGGLLIIGRSIDEENGRTAASVYERTAGGLNLLWDVNDGSEIKSVVQAVAGPRMESEVVRRQVAQ